MTLTWALKEVDPVGLHRQSGNCIHRGGGNWQEDSPPLANGALYLNTPKHNDKSGTGTNNNKNSA